MKGPDDTSNKLHFELLLKLCLHDSVNICQENLSLDLFYQAVFPELIHVYSMHIQ
jgi:hypothetical protein